MRIDKFSLHYIILALSFDDSLQLFCLIIYEMTSRSRWNLNSKPFRGMTLDHTFCKHCFHIFNYKHAKSHWIHTTHLRKACVHHYLDNARLSILFLQKKFDVLFGSPSAKMSFPEDLVGTAIEEKE